MKLNKLTTSFLKTVGAIVAVSALVLIIAGLGNFVLAFPRVSFVVLGVGVGAIGLFWASNYYTEDE